MQVLRIAMLSGMYVYLLPVFLFSRLIMQLLWACVFGCIIARGGQERVKDFIQWDWEQWWLPRQADFPRGSYSAVVLV